MRSGLFGAVGAGAQQLTESSVFLTGSTPAAFGQVCPAHGVQRSVLTAENDEVFGIHGAWLNAADPEWDHPRYYDHVRWVLSSSESFDEAEGPLHGMTWSSSEERLCLHADFARQHPLFYFVHEGGLVFSFSVDSLVGHLRALGLPVEPDEEGGALLLTYGCILGDQTLVQGIRKLMPGHSLEWTPTAWKVESRTDLLGVARDLNSEHDAIEALHSAFVASVAEVQRVNEAAGCASHALLSGGLDSRMVALALGRSVRDLSCLCFSVRNYADHQISQELASDQGWGYAFHDLGQGEYLRERATVLEYDGCVNYLASAHHRSALQGAQLPGLGILGSGQGANVLLTDTFRWRQSGDEVLAGMISYRGVLGTAFPSARRAWESCPGVQAFKIVNRGFLYTNSGAYSTVDFGVLWSPFTSRRFVLQALRLHPDLVSGQRAYLAWMAQHFPEALKYDWERYGVPPVRGARLRLAQLWARVRAKLRKHFPQRRTSSMSPLQHWYDTSPDLQAFFANSFDEHRDQLARFPHLREAVERDFSGMNVMNKASVLTLMWASQTWFRS